MLKVAILDDYQNISQDFLNLKKLSRKYEFKVFSEYFLNEKEAIEKLKDFEALLIMRERTKITKNLISNLKKLKYIDIFRGRPFVETFEVIIYPATVIYAFYIGFKILSEEINIFLPSYSTLLWLINYLLRLPLAGEYGNKLFLGTRGSNLI